MARKLHILNSKKMMGNLPLLPRVDNPVPLAAQKRGAVNNNYAKSVEEGDSQSELTKLKLKNKVIQLLLNEHLKRQIQQIQENETEASLTRHFTPPNNNHTALAPAIPPSAPIYTESRAAEKVKAV